MDKLEKTKQSEQFHFFVSLFGTQSYAPQVLRLYD